jgi:5'-deoxynucleotidase YfbR-like HD superfamily hydrolase
MKPIQENLYMVGHIRTFSGEYINIIDPDPASIHIEDIAHALAQAPRFGGHLKHFYSVAQHSLRVCRDAPMDYKLEALLHDAAEAYLTDMPAPIKALMPQYRQLESGLMRAIAEKFGLSLQGLKAVKPYDIAALELEWDRLMIKGENMEEDRAFVKAGFLAKYRFFGPASHYQSLMP